jgi:hypothetical protein
MPQTVPLPPAERHLFKVILRHELDLAAKQRQQHGVPPPPGSWRLARARDWAVGLVFSGVPLLLTIPDNGGDQVPHNWLFGVAVCLAIKAAGVKAGRVAGGLSVVSYFAVMVAPHSADLWQAIGEPKLWHLTAMVVAVLFCTTPPPGTYLRRMRRTIAWIAAKTPVSPSSRRMRRNIASIIARISASSPSGLPDRMRSISTS